MITIWGILILFIFLFGNASCATITAQKMKFSMKDFFSKCDQKIRLGPIKVLKSLISICRFNVMWSNKQFCYFDYSEPNQISKMERFVKIFNGRKPLPIFARSFTLDVWLGLKYALLAVIYQLLKFELKSELQNSQQLV